MNALLAQQNRPACDKLTHVPICHVGAGASTNYVTVCSDFGSLWGHLVQHPGDYIGECVTSIDDKVNIYACNAGLVHGPHSQDMCFDYEDNISGVLVQSCGDSSNCKCVGGSENETQHLRDYFNYAIADYNDQLNAPFVSKALKAGKYSMNEASDHQGHHVIANDKHVSFNLGSSRIGSEYFVDICWRILDENLRDLRFKVNATISVIENLFTDIDYLNTAEVDLKWEVYCDSSSNNSLSFPQNPIIESNYMPFTTGLATAQTDLPKSKGCYIRFQMLENEWDFLRPHDLKQVTLQTDVDVDLKDPLIAGDEPITFCHVEPVSNKDFKCTTRSFPNTEALRIWMQLGHNDHRTWRQNNQHNYRGQCVTEGPCSKR